MGGTQPQTSPTNEEPLTLERYFNDLFEGLKIDISCKMGGAAFGGRKLRGCRKHKGGGEDEKRQEAEPNPCSIINETEAELISIIKADEVKPNVAKTKFNDLPSDMITKIASFLPSSDDIVNFSLVQRGMTDSLISRFGDKGNFNAYVLSNILSKFAEKLIKHMGDDDKIFRLTFDLTDKTDTFTFSFYYMASDPEDENDSGSLLELSIKPKSQPESKVSADYYFNEKKNLVASSVQGKFPSIIDLPELQFKNLNVFHHVRDNTKASRSQYLTFTKLFYTVLRKVTNMYIKKIGDNSQQVEEQIEKFTEQIKLRDGKAVKSKLVSEIIIEEVPSEQCVLFNTYDDNFALNGQKAYFTESDLNGITYKNDAIVLLGIMEIQLKSYFTSKQNTMDHYDKCIEKVKAFILSERDTRFQLRDVVIAYMNRIIKQIYNEVVPKTHHGSGLFRKTEKKHKYKNREYVVYLNNRKRYIKLKGQYTAIKNLPKPIKKKSKVNAQ